MQHVHRPDCQVIYYQAAKLSQHNMPYHQILTHATYRNAKIPCGEKSSSGHDPIEETHRTLQKLMTTTIHVDTELGASAAEYFLRETVKALRANSSVTREFQLDMTDTTLSRLLYLLDGVTPTGFSTSQDPFPVVSSKVQRLLDYLLDNPKDDLRGIVFVQRRVIARILCDILNGHARSGGKLKCVYNVGTSNSSQKKLGITDLIDRKYQGLSLPSFRQGRANIIVATSVLEEGIDVQACNVVACFDSPPNVKAYIQRRGRARHQSSRYALLADDKADTEKLAQWNELEKELEKKCQDDREFGEICRTAEAQKEEQNYSLQTSVYVEDPNSVLFGVY
jgi:ERCC4-related helicase